MLNSRNIELLFWNLGRRDCSELVGECAVESDADIAVFAEWGNLDLDKLVAARSGAEGIIRDTHQYSQAKRVKPASLL